MFFLQLDPHHRQGQPERNSHQEHPENRYPELRKHLWNIVVQSIDIVDVVVDDSFDMCVTR